MATNIDSLSVQIRSNSAGAAKGIDALSASLDKLHKSLAGNGAMSSLAKINQAVKNAGENIGNAPDKIKALASAIDALGRAKTTGISENLAKRISDLSAAVRSLPGNADRKFADLAAGLGSLSAMSHVTISPNIGNQIANIGAALDAAKDVDFNRISVMAQALSSLAAVQSINLPRNIAENIFDLGAALEAIQDVDFSRIGTIAEAMAPLASIERAANLGPTLNQLKRLPAIFGELQAMDMNAFAEGIQRLVEALRPLAEAVERIGGGLNNLPERMRDLVTNVNRLNGGGGGGGRGGIGGRGFTQILAGLGIAQLGLRSFASVIKESIASANKYIEDINLFTASLGKYATQAKDYADTVSEVMGIDPAKWMRNQGVFMTLASGFGVAGDRAYIMSQQLTQLGYDLSSFFNIAVDGEGGAMQKLQAGIAGELEPLRRLGYDLSQAKLQAIALSQGITKAYNSMTQAEKVQLRYYAIMTQVTTAQGDMARTLNAPANQMRIFSAQLQMAARAIGNIFIPALNAILPYAIAFVKAIRFMAEAVASFFGYSLPEIDYSGLQEVAGGFDDIGEAAGGAAGQAAKLKSYLMGFDELNVIDPTQGGGGGGGSGSGGGGSGSGWDWELPTYDFLGDAVESRVDAVMAKLKPAIDWVRDNIQLVLTAIGGIATGMMAWKIASGFTDGINGIWDAMKGIMGIGLWLVTVGISAKITYNLDKDFIENGGVVKLLGESILAVIAAFAGYKVALPMFGVSAAWGFAGLALTISAGATLKALFDHADLSDWDWKTALTALVGVLKAAAGAGLITKAIVPGATLGQAASVAAIVGLTLTAGISLKALYDRVSMEGFDYKALVTALVGTTTAGISAYLTIRGLFSETVSKATAAGIGISLAVGIGASVVYAAEASKGDNANKATLLASSIISIAGNAISGAIVGAKFLDNPLLGGVIAASLTVGIGALVNLSSKAQSGKLDTAAALASSIISIASGAITGVAIAKMLGLSLIGGGLVGAIAATIGIAVTLSRARVINKDDLKNPAKWGDVTLTADEMRTFAENLFGGIDVEAVINVSNAKVTGVEDAKSQIDGELEEYASKLRLLNLGIGVDKESVQDTYNYVFGEGGMLETWQNILKKEDNFMEYGVSLMPQEINFDSASFLKIWTDSTDILNEAMDKAGKELVEIFNAAQDRELNASEEEMVQKYLDFIYKIQSATARGEAYGAYKQGESKLLSGVDLTALDRTSFVGVLTEWSATAESFKTTLEAVNSQMISTLTGRIEGLQEVVNFYGEDSEIGARAKETMLALQTQLDELMAEGFVDAQWDSYTAEGRQKFLDAIAKIYATPFESGAINFDPWHETFSSFFATIDDNETIEEVKQGFENVIQKVMAGVVGEEDAKFFFDVSKMLGISGWDMFSSDMQENLFEVIASILGENETRKLFSQMGYDLGSLYSDYLFQGITDEEEHAKPKFSAVGEKINKTISDAATDKAENSGKSYINKLFTGISDEEEHAKPKFSAVGESVVRRIGDAMFQPRQAKYRPRNMGQTLGDDVKSGATSSLIGLAAAVAASTAGLSPAMFSAGKSAKEKYNEGLDGTPTSTIETAVTLFKDGWTTPDGWVSQYIGGPVQQSVELIKQGWTTIKQFVVNAGVDIVEQAIKLTQHGWTTVDKYTEDHQGTGTVDEGVTLSTDFGSGIDTISEWAGTPGILGAGFVSIETTLTRGWGGTGVTVTDWVKTPSILGAGVVSMSTTLSKGWTGTPQSALGIPSSTSITVGLKTDGSVLKLQTTVQGAATTAMTLALQKVMGKANGGYVSTGQLFMAREAGPELVGSIGNRTAVANNDQIVQGIEGGVRTANEDVVAAIYTLIGAVENKDMSVNVGDDAIGRANARYTRKRGVVVNPGAFANSY